MRNRPLTPRMARMLAKMDPAGEYSKRMLMEDFADRQVIAGLLRRGLILADRSGQWPVYRLAPLKEVSK